MKTAYKLFEVFGIPITVDASLIVLLLMFIFNFENPLTGLVMGCVLILSVLLHELGHSLVGMAFGGKVRDIRLMMLGGCATMTAMPKKAWQEILMAFAGPFVSILISGIAFAIGMVFFFAPGYTPKGTEAFISDVVTYTFYLNIVLFCFNMLPAFPMDGGRILRATLQQFFTTRLKATWIASRIGRFCALLMGGSVLYSLYSGQFHSFKLIRLFIALMIYQAAEREYQMVLMEERGPRNPFGFPFFGQGRNSRTPPDDTQAVVSPPPRESTRGYKRRPDDTQAVVSPPPYQPRGSTRVDVHKED